MARAQGSGEQRDQRIIGAILAVLFLGIVALAPSQVSVRGVPSDAAAVLSPRFFPYVLGSVGLLLALLHVFKPDHVPDEEDPYTFLDIAMALGIWFIALLYANVVEMAGYHRATALALVAMMLLYGQRRVVTIGVTAVAFTSLIFWAFTKALFVPLPGDGFF